MLKRKIVRENVHSKAWRVSIVSNTDWNKSGTELQRNGCLSKHKADLIVANHFHVDTWENVFLLWFVRSNAIHYKSAKTKLTYILKL